MKLSTSAYGERIRQTPSTNTLPESNSNASLHLTWLLPPLIPPRYLTAAEIQINNPISSNQMRSLA